MTETVSSPAPGVTRGWTADDSTFGARLALIRQRMGWGNVKEAADACGIPVESWRRWERDGRSPRELLEVAGVIAERTGCDYAWLTKRPEGRLVTTGGAQRGTRDAKLMVQTKARPSGVAGRSPRNRNTASSSRRTARVSPALATV